MRLALFDLDHTLIPFDSGLAWTRHLVDTGLVPAETWRRHLAICDRFVAGDADGDDVLRASLATTTGLSTEALQEALAAFERSIGARVPAAMRRQVDAHREQGDLCAIVTATPRPFAEPFARAFGIDHLLASEVAVEPRGLTMAGASCRGAHKVERVARWLAPRALHDFERTSFYSDSISDLPLLERVTDPVAVRPDAPLRVHAVAQGWRIVEEGGA